MNNKYSPELHLRHCLARLHVFYVSRTTDLAELIFFPISHLLEVITSSVINKLDGVYGEEKIHRECLFLHYMGDLGGGINEYI